MSQAEPSGTQVTQLFSSKERKQLPLTCLCKCVCLSTLMWKSCPNLSLPAFNRVVKTIPKDNEQKEKFMCQEIRKKKLIHSWTQITKNIFLK